MLVLGIETSCDETALAIVEYQMGRGDPTHQTVNPNIHSIGKVKILSQRVYSQISIHERYGGVVPEIAAREHLRALPLLLDEVLSESRLSLKELSGIAVTQGPGLKGALLIGFSFAKGLASSSGLPIVGVNHIEGHLLSPLIDYSELEFPFIGLVVSGGHTEIVEAKSPGNYNVLCRTTDDAAGEAFDKSAALLGFPYPGGAALSNSASSAQGGNYKLPRVMLERSGLSFSGLKTAVSLLVRRELNDLNDVKKRELCHAIESAIVEVLVRKTKEASDAYGVRNIAVSGGVAANNRLRSDLSSIFTKERTFFAKKEYCSDNAVMIAFVGAWRLSYGERLKKRGSVFSRWPIEDMRPPTRQSFD